MTKALMIPRLSWLVSIHQAPPATNELIEDVGRTARLQYPSMHSAAQTIEVQERDILQAVYLDIRSSLRRVNHCHCHIAHASALTSLSENYNSVTQDT